MGLENGSKNGTSFVPPITQKHNKEPKLVPNLGWILVPFFEPRVNTSFCSKRIQKLQNKYVVFSCHPMALLLVSSGDRPAR